MTFSTSWNDSLGFYWKVYNILWLQFLNGSVNNNFFTKLCFQQAVLNHVALNANELYWPRPSLLWSDEQTLNFSRETG